MMFSDPKWRTLTPRVRSSGCCDHQKEKKRFGNVKRPPRKKKPNRNNCNNCNNKFRSVLLAPEFRVEEELSDADAQDSTRL